MRIRVPSNARAYFTLAFLLARTAILLCWHAFLPLIAAAYILTLCLLSIVAGLLLVLLGL